MHPALESLHQSPEESLRLITAGGHEAAQGCDYPFHQHTAWELVYYRSGSIDFLLGNDQAIPVEPGMLIFAPPRVAHSERALTAYANFHLLVEVFSPVQWPLFCLDDSEQSLNRLCARIVAEFRSTRHARGEMLRLLLGELSISLARAISAAQTTRAEKAVRRAEITLANSFRNPVLLAVIAKQVGVSPAALRAHFATLRGYSPREYLRNMRLSHARSLLQTSDLTLEHIAELSGFSSASHLSRCVKKEWGKSPGTLRTRALPSQIPVSKY